MQPNWQVSGNCTAYYWWCKWAVSTSDIMRWYRRWLLLSTVKGSDMNHVCSQITPAYIAQNSGRPLAIHKVLKLHNALHFTCPYGIKVPLLLNDTNRVESSWLSETLISSNSIPSSINSVIICSFSFSSFSMTMLSDLQHKRMLYMSYKVPTLCYTSTSRTLQNLS